MKKVRKREERRRLLRLDGQCFQQHKGKIPKRHLGKFYIGAASALQCFQFVCPDRWRLGFQLGERKANPTASERTASLGSA